ncbi:MAG: aldehyde ferredoxin oxidoreductase family protein, partial [Candidatus Aerophobetes bacterium]|nr:aldehyde ferredoxin oxidoreductase family protein [Candidatus Aerophobetes bacterium]
MYGWTGKILYIDLTTNEMETKHLDESFLYKYLGGRGVNSKILYDAINEIGDPFSANNPIIISAGPSTGTSIPGSNRFTITSKSPLTGLLGDSNSGAPFASEIKKAGYDTIVIKGKSKFPCYIYLEDGNIQIRKADHIWGETTFKAEKIIKQELKDSDVKVISIGPAGENLVKFACAIGDKSRASGRTGIGAVMGSKNLKAIAIKGHGKVDVAYSEQLDKLCKQIIDILKSDKEWYRIFSNYGALGLVISFNKMGVMPVRNFQTGVIDIRGIQPELFMQKYHAGYESCLYCPIHCGHYYHIKDGKYAGTTGYVRAFATPADLGVRIGTTQYDAILKTQSLVNELGLDTISTGGVISWAMECYEEGILTLADTGGLKLNWGNNEAVHKLIKMIAFRKRFGDLLAEGSFRAAKEIGKGSEEYVMHTKKMEMTDMDPRGQKGWGLGYATSSRGNDHMRAYPAMEIVNAPQARKIANYPDVSRFAHEYKGKLVAWHENLRAVLDSLEICKFLSRTALISPKIFCEILRVITGMEISPEELLKTGERIVNIERMLNNKLGATRRDDSL